MIRILHYSAVYDETTDKGREAVAKARSQAQDVSKTNPTWTVKVWNASMSRDLIKRVRPDLLSTYDGFGDNVQRSDMARVAALYDEGGLYMDLDYVVTAPGPVPLDNLIKVMFENADDKTISAVNGTRNGGKASNSLMVSRRARDPFWNEYLDNMKANSKYLKWFSRYFHVLTSTGPSRLNATISSSSQTKPIIAASGKVNPCGLCDFNSSCRSGTEVVAYHDNAGSWNGAGSKVWKYCYCYWETVLGMGIGLVIIILLLVVILRRGNCSPCQQMK